MSHKIKVLVCYDMDAILSKKSIDTINEFNSKINPYWVFLEYDKELIGDDSGVNYWMLHDNQPKHNGTLSRTLNGEQIWILPFIDGMPFDKSIEGVYDIYTEEEYIEFEKTLDTLTEEEV